MLWGRDRKIDKTLVSLDVCLRNLDKRLQRVEDHLALLAGSINSQPLVYHTVTNIEARLEKYLDNMDRVNSMVNEFKGCVSMARASLEDRKTIEKEVEKILEKVKRRK